MASYFEIGDQVIIRGLRPCPLDEKCATGRILPAEELVTSLEGSGSPSAAGPGISDILHQIVAAKKIDGLKRISDLRSAKSGDKLVVIGKERKKPSRCTLVNITSNHQAEVFYDDRGVLDKINTLEDSVFKGREEFAQLPSSVFYLNFGRLDVSEFDVTKSQTFEVTGKGGDRTLFLQQGDQLKVSARAFAEGEWLG